MSEKLARNDIDNLGETRTARNRWVFRLQMQLWPCDSTRSGTIEANRSPKRRFRFKRLSPSELHAVRVFTSSVLVVSFHNRKQEAQGQLPNSPPTLDNRLR